MPKRKPCPYCGFGLAPIGYIEIDNLKIYHCHRCDKRIIFRNKKLYNELKEGK